MLFIEIKRAHKHHDVILTVGAVFLLNVSKSNGLKVAHPFPDLFLFIITNIFVEICFKTCYQVLLAMTQGRLTPLGMGFPLVPMTTATPCVAMPVQNGLTKVRIVGRLLTGTVYGA